MTIKSQIELDGTDLNRVLDLCGHFHRAEKGGEHYQKLVPYMKEAVQELAQRAFQAGREFERKQTA